MISMQVGGIINTKEARYKHSMVLGLGLCECK